MYEAGYQHFGLVVSKCNGKALVIPMTSNTSTYEQAYDIELNPNGKKHLMKIGQIIGLHRPSVLFLNDQSWVESAELLFSKSLSFANSKTSRP